MTYENLVKEAKKAVKTVDVKTIKEHLAVEFDIEGKAEGAFYAEFSSNKAEVEPYEYYDHDFRVRTDAATSIAILKGEISPADAIAQGKASVEGNDYKVGLLGDILKLEAAPKKTTKKAADKKTTTTAKKTTTTKKTTTAKKTTTKAAETKAAEKKPVPKKVTKKPATKATPAKK